MPSSSRSSILLPPTPQLSQSSPYLHAHSFFLFLSMATPTAYASSQARGRTGGAAAHLLGSELHLCPAQQLAATPDP